MNFAVDVTDAALDTLPQDLSFAAFGQLIDAIESTLGSDPIRASRKIKHPDDDTIVKACFGGFEVEACVCLFTVYFYYSLDERSVHVWRIHLTEE
jgi:hypothetical protein